MKCWARSRCQALRAPWWQWGCCDGNNVACHRFLHVVRTVVFVHNGRPYWASPSRSIPSVLCSPISTCILYNALGNSSGWSSDPYPCPVGVMFPFSTRILYTHLCRSSGWLSYPYPSRLSPFALYALLSITWSYDCRTFLVEADCLEW